MATDKSSKGPKEGESTPAQTGDQPRIVWDSSDMRSAYANVFNVAGAREEFVFFFGMNQSWDAGQKELKVQLTDRIVMSPFAAKRLAILLNNVLKDYEKRYGELEVIAKRPEDATVQ
jgi:hypothetical protein